MLVVSRLWWRQFRYKFEFVDIFIWYLSFVIYTFFSKMPPRSKKPCLVIPGQLKLNFRPKSEDTVKGIMMIHYCRVVKTGFWSSQLLRPYIHGRNHWGSGGSRPPQLLGRPQIFTLHFAGGRLLVRSGHWKSLGGLANAKYWQLKQSALSSVNLRKCLVTLVHTTHFSEQLTAWRTPLIATYFHCDIVTPERRRVTAAQAGRLISSALSGSVR